MEYRDKKTLRIMSGFNKDQDEYLSSRRGNREYDRERKKFAINFYLRNIYIMDRIWWLFLSDNDRYDVARIWTCIDDKSSICKEQFFIDMKRKFDKTQQIRDKKLESLL